MGLGRGQPLGRTRNKTHKAKASAREGNKKKNKMQQGPSLPWVQKEGAQGGPRGGGESKSLFFFKDLSSSTPQGRFAMRSLFTLFK
jgi:hypothetical protein